jgi:ClpP class serine protease
MTKPKQREAHRYERRGVLAVEPSAFFDLFFMPDAPPVNEERTEATIVTIRGPLEQHAGSWCDSYEAIRERVALACESSAPAVVLRIDSPGGDAQGCFDAARELRAMCAGKRKALYAYVEGHGCSAAYALASAAGHIALGDTATVGSIGVLSTRDDYSAANSMRGMRVAFIASGSRKTYGHPDSPLTEAELADTQGIVDSMASVFFDLVAEMRPKLSAEAVQALDAGVFHGTNAIAMGLADSVQPLAALLANIGKGSAMADDDKKKKDGEGGSPFETARAALEEAAKVDDANGQAAKRALAALMAGAGGDEEPPADDDASAADDDEDDPKAATDDDKKKAEAGDDDKKAAADDKKEAASAYGIAAKAMSKVTRLEARLAASEQRERDALIASRPDFTAEYKAVLAKAPLSTVRELVKPSVTPLAATAAPAKPKPGQTINNPRVAALAQPMRGKDQDGFAAQLPPSEKRDMDLRMGLLAQTPGVLNTDYKLTLGVLTDKVTTDGGS